MKDETKEPRKSIVAQISEKTAPLFEKIGKLSKKQRLLICLGTLVLFGAGYYYFFLGPRLEKIESLKKNETTLKGQLATYKRKAASLAEMEKKYEDAQDDFYTALQALPDSKEIPSLIKAISKSGSDAGLEFLLFKPEAVVQKDFYAEIPVSIRVEGGYHQLAEFFDRVAQLSRLVNIFNISMGSGRDGTLNVSCRAVTYMFVEKIVDADKGATPAKSRRGGRR
ncbi:MAG: type 4a pilus biogenesis protein PilO [Desulfamplus sp.]|nr:type 4a pilus biogenesis protein PilO [Desulfamplus sp.]